MIPLAWAVAYAVLFVGSMIQLYYPAAFLGRLGMGDGETIIKNPFTTKSILELADTFTGLHGNYSEASVMTKASWFNSVTSTSTAYPMVANNIILPWWTTNLVLYLILLLVIGAFVVNNRCSTASFQVADVFRKLLETIQESDADVSKRLRDLMSSLEQQNKIPDLYKLDFMSHLNFIAGLDDQHSQDSVIIDSLTVDKEGLQEALISTTILNRLANQSTCQHQAEQIKRVIEAKDLIIYLWASKFQEVNARADGFEAALQEERARNRRVSVAPSHPSLESITLHDARSSLSSHSSEQTEQPTARDLSLATQGDCSSSGSLDFDGAGSGSASVNGMAEGDETVPDAQVSKTTRRYKRNTSRHLDAVAQAYRPSCPPYSTLAPPVELMKDAARMLAEKTGKEKAGRKKEKKQRNNQSAKERREVRLAEAVAAQSQVDAETSEAAEQLPEEEPAVEPIKHSSMAVSSSSQSGGQKHAQIPDWMKKERTEKAEVEKQTADKEELPSTPSSAHDGEAVGPASSAAQGSVRPLTAEQLQEQQERRDFQRQQRWPRQPESSSGSTSAGRASRGQDGPAGVFARQWRQTAPPELRVNQRAAAESPESAQQPASSQQQSAPADTGAVPGESVPQGGAQGQVGSERAGEPEDGASESFTQPQPSKKKRHHRGGKKTRERREAALAEQAEAADA